MGKYPLIEKMGLRIDQMWPVNTVTYSGNIGYSVIKADDLEAALEMAMVVYGSNSSAWGMQSSGDTHKALLICVEEIKKHLDKSEKICDINSVMGRTLLPFFDDIDPKECRLKITVEKIP